MENNENAIQTNKMGLEYKHTIIIVMDVHKTLDFYQKVFGFEKKHVDEANCYGELDTGNTTLSFASYGMSPNLSSEKDFCDRVILSFQSNDVKKDYEEVVKNGAVAFKEPEEKPWKQTVAYCRDINGMLIEIASKINTIKKCAFCQNASFGISVKERRHNRWIHTLHQQPENASHIIHLNKGYKGFEKNLPICSYCKDDGLHALSNTFDSISGYE